MNFVKSLNSLLFLLYIIYNNNSYNVNGHENQIKGLDKHEESSETNKVIRLIFLALFTPYI